MRLEWIEDILAVHDAGSLRAAADQRLLTASAFTRRIKAVEEAIGGELFDRSNKPVTLRPHVIELIPRLRELSAGLKQTQSELSGLAAGGQITRVICQHTLSVTWAPRVAKLFASEGMHMRIKSGSKDDCSLSVIKNNADFAIIYEDPHINETDDHHLFDRIGLATERFLPVAALKHNAQLQQTVSAKRLPLITYPRNLFLGEVLERALSKSDGRGVVISVIAESGLGPVVLEFVREGVGIGWLPYSIVETDLNDGFLTDLSDLLPAFDLEVVAVRSKSDVSRRTKQIWALIEENFSAG